MARYPGHVRFRVSYDRPSDFADDYRGQIARGGLLVRVALPVPPERGAEVQLEIATPVGEVRLAAQVIQVLAGAGVAVTVDPSALADLARAAAAAPDQHGDPPRHELLPDEIDDLGTDDLEIDDLGTDDPGTEAPGAHAPPVHESLRAATLARKVQQALHGDKNQRTALLREHNKLIYGYVVRNAQIQLDEVVAIARMPTMSADVLTYIASRREWAERPEVAAALVRNPRIPVPLAIRLLDHVHPAELRQLAKHQTVREAIQRVVRKKVIG